MMGLARRLALSAGALFLGAVMASHADAGGRVLVPSDTVSIRILEDPDLSTTTRVEPDGTINFPYVGRIKATGRTEDDVAREIERRLIEAKIIAPP